jgi:dienelactone hydrolase
MQGTKERSKRPLTETINETHVMNEVETEEVETLVEAAIAYSKSLGGQLVEEIYAHGFCAFAALVIAKVATKLSDPDVLWMVFSATLIFFSVLVYLIRRRKRLAKKKLKWTPKWEYHDF